MHRHCIENALQNAAERVSKCIDNSACILQYVRDEFGVATDDLSFDREFDKVTRHPTW